MSELTVTEPSSGYFALGGDLDRNTVPNVWSNGMASLKQSRVSNIIDMQGVDHCDTAGLAWLINLLRDCKKQNVEVELKNVPETLINLAKISDVEGFLPLQ